MSASRTAFAGALAAAALLGCASTPTQEAPAPLSEERTGASERVPTPAPVPRPAPAPAALRLTVAAVGDMMLGTDYPENRLPDDDGVSFLAQVTPVLAAADVAFGNLEGVLMDGGEPRKRCSNPAACYLFRSPARYAQHFAAAGFDVLSLANNHALDFGETGRSATMRHLDEAGIRHSGRIGDIATWTVAGLRVGTIAYAVTRNSHSMLEPGAAAVEVAALAAGHDILIVSFHGGAEGEDALHLPFGEETYYGEPRGDVVAFARAMIDAGADLVLGHGPHVVRAMEHYRGRLIAYSLGNFATYYGISVSGLKGVAPILVVTLDGAGRFVEGRIHSTVQRRPQGPSLDPAGRALALIRELSHADFPEPGLRFADDGTIAPLP